MELRYEIARSQDVAVVRCSGRMVRGGALEGFRRRIEGLEGLRILVLDLSEVEHIDAGGLGALLLLRRWAVQPPVALKLVNPSPFVRRILEATRLTSVFEIASLEEALCVLRAPQSPSQYAVA